ncbi:MAG: hypothetical protein ACK54H_06435, partial [Phycisphaerales bacterium]
SIVLLREPTPGEVISEAWDVKQLTDAGYPVGEDGKLIVGEAPKGSPQGARTRPVNADGGSKPTSK